MPLPAPANESPCVGICHYDPDLGFCVGCLRTLDEIGAWGALTALQRAELMQSLALRRARRASPAPSE